MKIRWTQQDEDDLMALRKIFTIINRKKREAAMAEWRKNFHANRSAYFRTRFLVDRFSENRDFLNHCLFYTWFMDVKIR